MKTNHRHYILILFAVACLVVSIFVYLFVYKKTIGIAQNYSKLTNEMNSEDGRKRYEEELVKVYDNTEGSRQKIYSIIANEDKIVSFIETVEKIGDYTNTDFELSSISNDKGNIKAKVKVEGNWANIMRALSLIENLPISSKISNIALSTSQGLESDLLKSKSSNVSSKWKLNLDIEAITIK